jgi:ketopantoate reductase
VRILILVAVGGCFEAQLTQSGRDVMFPARAPRFAQLRSTGIQIPTNDGIAETAPVHVNSIDDLDSTYDLIIASALPTTPA